MYFTISTLFFVRSVYVKTNSLVLLWYVSIIFLDFLIALLCKFFLKIYIKVSLKIDVLNTNNRVYD